MNRTMVSIFSKRLKIKHIQLGTGNYKGYFVAILTRRETIRIEGEEEVVPFPTTTMDRNLLVVHGRYLIDVLAKWTNEI